MTHSENTTPSAANPHAADDPRQGLLKAIALAGRTVAAVRAEQLDGPTPCTEFTVRRLAGHLVAVLRRIALAGRGGDVTTLPTVADDLADTAWQDAWDAAVREVETAWADPAVLGRILTLPFGTLPGAAAAAVWTSEFTVHTWDVATATDQTPDWDPELVAISYAAMKRGLPDGPRDGAPFGAAVDVDADAPAIDRLVAWCGRKP
ncbi:TIGR03086 family metal-binding protein [Streptomyces sp. NPDC054835]|uniref:TIGR03086 family metal-binding protein n=1 Tax=Streptomyces sp. NBC_01268 TaxID=2903806 RepID=UPI002E3031A7|nr:TIGR03086 family metal-binding protein [Streptomyces sp. NBC_01268]